MGRPTDYEAEYHNDKAFKLALLGMSDKEMADVFSITEQTLNNWKKAHPAFFESIKKGKYDADGEIASSLYHRAKGYSHPDEKIFNDNGEPLIVPTVKHYPPDTAAAFIWLKNRRPKEWREKVESESTIEIKTGFNKIAMLAQREGLTVEAFAQREGLSLEDLSNNG